MYATWVILQQQGGGRGNDEKKNSNRKGHRVCGTVVYSKTEIANIKTENGRLAQKRGTRRKNI